jgi:uncharacterized Zn-finger protein
MGIKNEPLVEILEDDLQELSSSSRVIITQQLNRNPRSKRQSKAFTYPLYPLVYVTLDRQQQQETGQSSLQKRSKSPTPSSLACKICRKVCGNMGSLQRHIEVHRIINCALCNQNFIGKAEFREHKKDCPRLEKPNRCNICGRSCRSKGTLKNHMAVHVRENTDENLRCKICDRICGNAGSLALHMTSHEPEKKARPCTYCEMVLPDKFKLRTHMRNCPQHPANTRSFIEPVQEKASEVNKHKCSYCGKICGNKGSYKIHVMCYHNEALQLQCNECEKKFVDKAELEKHIKRSIKSDKVRYSGNAFKCSVKGVRYLKKCPQCSQSFTSRELKSHILRVHGRDVAFVCKFCGKGYDMLTKLEIHERQHTGERPFECDICGKCFISPATLKDHKSRHGALPQFECEICKKKFRHKAELRQHRLIHDKNARIYVCHICGASHYKKQALEKHQMIHTRERPFQCDICGKSFSYRDVLRRHMLQHTGGEEPAYCEICGKGFSSKLHINRHLMIHTGERPHQCDICKQTFVQASALRTHRMLRHKILPYECSFCGERFKIRMDMLGHIDENHRSFHLPIATAENPSEHTTVSQDTQLIQQSPQYQSHNMAMQILPQIH